jgi:hypothetical protein
MVVVAEGGAVGTAAFNNGDGDNDGSRHGRRASTPRRAISIPESGNLFLLFRLFRGRRHLCDRLLSDLPNIFREFPQPFAG